MSLVMEQPAADVPPKVKSTQAKESTQAKDKYDPKYDPLKDESPGHGKEYAPTYWVDSDRFSASRSSSSSRATPRCSTPVESTTARSP